MPPNLFSRLLVSLVHFLGLLLFLSSCTSPVQPVGGIYVGTFQVQTGGYETTSAVRTPARHVHVINREFEQYKATHRISRNSIYQNMVWNVGLRLSKVIPMQNADWEFVVFENPLPNAFATPGGKVGVTTGLFRIVQNEAQLAAVIGHEISHVVAGHAAARNEENLTGALLGAMIPDQEIGNMVTNLYKIARLLPFSREQELEADRMGTLFMARAGFDPHEAVRLWVRFAKYRRATGNGNGPEITSDHPMDERRIAALQRFLPKAMAEYRR